MAKKSNSSTPKNSTQAKNLVRGKEWIDKNGDVHLPISKLTRVLKKEYPALASVSLTRDFLTNYNPISHIANNIKNDIKDRLINRVLRHNRNERLTRITNRYTDRLRRIRHFRRNVITRNTNPNVLLGRAIDKSFNRFSDSRLLHDLHLNDKLDKLNRALICSKRKVRRQVIFALTKGKGMSGVKKARWTAESRVRC